MTFRIASAAMAVLFAVAIAVQYNDPDPLPWMLAYALPCAFAAAASRGRRWPRLSAALAALYFLAFLGFVPALLRAREQAFSHWHMLSSADEEAREGGGVALAALWLGVLAFRHRAR